MVELTEAAAVRAWTAEQRAAGRRIALVPTMGALHEGHLSLVDEARRRAGAVIMSVFVNPLQFGPHEDLARYPRDLDRDRDLASARGVHALFVPAVTTMYPTGSETRVVPGRTAERWEGVARPGHFVGVLTVVAKLFHLVQPDVACFGQKDIQQAIVVRKMVRDLDWPLEIALMPTVREPDGLALSSRNAYLLPAQRQEALGLSQALFAARDRWRRGERSAERLEELMRKGLEVFQNLTVEYIAIADPDRLDPLESAPPGTVIAIAARIGSVRLIDNVIL
jgi:pantoate--beta-alanine ligase